MQAYIFYHSFFGQWAMSDTSKINAYGNRQARLRRHTKSKVDLSHDTVIHHLGKLHAQEKREQKKTEKELISEVEKILASNKMSEREKIAYLLALPQNTPFRKINKKLLPELFITMRQRWFKSSH